MFLPERSSVNFNLNSRSTTGGRARLPPGSATPKHPFPRPFRLSRLWSEEAVTQNQDFPHPKSPSGCVSLPQSFTAASGALPRQRTAQHCTSHELSVPRFPVRTRRRRAQALPDVPPRTKPPCWAGEGVVVGPQQEAPWQQTRTQGGHGQASEPGAGSCWFRGVILEEIPPLASLSSPQHFSPCTFPPSSQSWTVANTQQIKLKSS